MRVNGEWTNIVVGNFFTSQQVSPRVQANLFLAIDRNNFGMTIRLARVVDESGQVAAGGCVDDGVAVDAEQVAAADALGFVQFLAVIGHTLTHNFPNVLNDNVVCGNVLQTEEAPVVN